MDGAAQVNSLIGAISRRQKREKIIIAAVIGTCTSLMIIYGFS